MYSVSSFVFEIEDISICISKAYKSMWTLILYIPISLVIPYQNEYQCREFSKLILSKDLEIAQTYVFHHRLSKEIGINSKGWHRKLKNKTQDRHFRRF